MTHLSIPGPWQQVGRRSLALAIVLLLAIAGTLACIAGRTAADERTREREEAIVLQLHGLLEDLQNAEIARSRYLLTGAEGHLRPYLRSRERIANHLQQLESLTSTDPQLLEAVEQLMVVSGQIIANIGRSIELRREGGDERTLALVVNRGAGLMEEIHQGIAQAHAQAAQAEQHVTRAWYGRLRQAGVSLGLTAMFISGVLVWGYNGYRRSLRALTAQSNQLSYEAMHDALTGLPNRRKLLAELASAASRAQGDGAKLAMLYMDIDGFKAINDTMGHEAGDQLLQAIAKRFSAVVRPSDMLARVGGDEFVLLVPEFRESARLAELAQRLMRELRALSEQDYDGQVGVSVGIATFPDPVGEVQDLLSASDRAMYEAKRRGGNRACFLRISAEDGMVGLIPAALVPAAG